MFKKLKRERGTWIATYGQSTAIWIFFKPLLPTDTKGVETHRQPVLNQHILLEEETKIIIYFV
jgi:hypothetical protein